MKTMRKLIPIVFLATLALIAVNGLSCRRATNQTKPKLTLWVVDYKATNFRQKIQTFAKRNKVEVETKELKKSELENQLLNALATHQGPDIVMIDNDFLTKHRELFLPCISGVKKNQVQYCSLETLKKNYVPVTQSLVWDNKIYGYPYRVSTPMVFYNKKMFAQVRNQLQISRMPYWWDDFVKVAQALTQKDNQGNITRAGVALGTAKNNPIAQDILYSLMLQNGSKITNSDPPPLALFHLPLTLETGATVYPGVKALEFYSSFSYPKSANYSFNLNFPQAWKAFAQEKIAILIDYPERLDQIRNLNPNLQIGTSLFPQIKNTDNPTVYGKVYLFGILKDTKNPVLAWQLARYLAPTFTYRYVKKSEIKDWRKARSTLTIWQTQVNFARTIYKDKYPERFDQIIRTMIDDLAQGKIKPKPAIERAATQINELITSNE